MSSDIFRIPLGYHRQSLLTVQQIITNQLRFHKISITLKNQHVKIVNCNKTHSWLSFFTPKGATFVAALAISSLHLMTLGTHLLAEGSKPFSFKIIAKTVIRHPFSLQFFQNPARKFLFSSQFDDHWQANSSLIQKNPFSPMFDNYLQTTKLRIHHVTSGSANEIQLRRKRSVGFW